MSQKSAERNPDRVQREQAAYDEGDVWTENDRLHRRFAHVFSCPDTEAANRYYHSRVARAAGNGAVLDYGCYDGEQTADLLAAHPKRVIGIDISKQAIERARKRFGKKATFHVMDAHHMTFPDGSFDLVAGKAILHHLDFETAVSEIQRILKPGGVAIFYEPLRDNPGARLIRWLTPRARTADELPLSQQQIKSADRIFGLQEHYFLNLISVPAGMISSFLFSSPDNFLTRWAYHLDRLLARTPARYWMRYVILVWEKQPL